MTTQVIAIADRRRRAMINQWVHDPAWVLVQVESPEMLRGKVHNITAEAEARIGRVGSHRQRSVIMLEGGPDRDRTWSVWVRATFSNYKPAYLAFISHAYKVTLTGDDVPGARRRGATLVTANAREFARVPGLKTQDWAA